MAVIYGRSFDVTGEWATVGVLKDNVIMSYMYCSCLSFIYVVAPIGAAAHHVVEGLFLLMSTGRICEFFATVIAVTVGPAVLRGARGQQL